MQHLKERIEREAERFAKEFPRGADPKEDFICGANFALEMERWIEIKEGCVMPAQGEKVYVLQDRERQVAGNYIDGEFIVLGNIGIVGVTHWMPQLPLP